MNTLSVLVFLVVLETCYMRVEYPSGTLKVPYDVPQCEAVGEKVGKDAGINSCEDVVGECTAPPAMMFTRAAPPPEKTLQQTLATCRTRYVAKCVPVCNEYYTTCLFDNPAIGSDAAKEKCGNIVTLFDDTCENECTVAFNQALS